MDPFENLFNVMDFPKNEIHVHTKFYYQFGYRVSLRLWKINNYNRAEGSLWYEYIISIISHLDKGVSLGQPKPYFMSD